MIPILTSSVDADVQAHINRLTAPSAELKDHLNTLILGLKADALWDKLETVCVVHPNENESLFDLKGFMDSVKIGAPTFIADRGFTMVVGGYIDSQLTPYSNTVKFANANNSMFCYMRVRGTTFFDQKFLGSFTNTPYRNLNLSEELVFNKIIHTNGNGSGPTISDPRIIGFCAGSRIDTNSVIVCHDGNTKTAPVFLGDIPATNLYVGGINDPTGAGHTPWVDCQMAGWGFGQGMSVTELTLLYNRILSYMTSRGANV